MNGLDLPRTREELTPAWIARALSIAHPAAVVRSVTIDRVVPGSATHVYVSVEYGAEDSGLPRQLFIKGATEAHSASIPWIYLHEVRFYNEVRPLLDITMPRCLLAAADAEGFPAVLVLEDIAAQNVTFCHASTPLTFDQASAFIDGFARLHAPWFGDIRLEAGGALDWLEPRAMVSQSYVDSMFSPERWSHYLSLPRAGAIPFVFHDPVLHRRALERVLEFRGTQPHVILLGDPHVSNVYLQKDGTAGFVDPQCRRGPWFQDVTYFLVSALDPLDRRQWDRTLIERYLDQLRSRGVTSTPPLDEALSSYAREIMRGLFIFTINSAKFQTELVNTIYSLRFSTAAADWNTYGLLLD